MHVNRRFALISKVIELRKQKAMKGRRKPLAEGEIEKIESESKLWVENGTKATTNRSLAVLRAMFNFLVKRGTISKSDVPEFPMAANVDNKRRGYLDERSSKTPEGNISDTPPVRKISLRHRPALRTSQGPDAEDG